MFEWTRFATGLLRLLPPETAHRFTIGLLRRGLVPKSDAGDDPILACRVFGLDFPNPVGLAAGFDKNAEVPDAMLALGFGFAEVGSVTPRPQPGNPRPRLFRLIEDRALINRMGFNNEGLDAVQHRLAERTRGHGIVGANLGKNKDTVEAADDYRLGVAALGPYADFLVVNVSSPNTPGLRALQGKAPLEALIGAVLEARTALALSVPPPVLLKIAPDVTSEDCRDIADVVRARKLDGLIVGNTTITRPDMLLSPHKRETGGLSGRSLFPLASALVSEMYGLTDGRIPIVGVGGVSSGRDAYALIRKGAALVELYTALVYEGPGLVPRIKAGLAALLRRDGFATVAQAVGADHRKGAPSARN